MKITVIKCNVCNRELEASPYMNRVPVAPGVHMTYDTGDPDEDNSGDVCKDCQECIAKAIQDTVADLQGDHK